MSSAPLSLRLTQAAHALMSALGDHRRGLPLWAVTYLHVAIERLRKGAVDLLRKLEAGTYVFMDTEYFMVGGRDGGYRGRREEAEAVDGEFQPRDVGSEYAVVQAPVHRKNVIQTVAHAVKQPSVRHGSDGTSRRWFA